MKATRKTIPNLIEKREFFTNTSGTMKAGRPTALLIRDTLTLNLLDDIEKSRLRIDWEQNGIAYMVMSYDIPIAWETKTGEVYKVGQELSQTSERHKGLLYLFHKRDTR